MSKLEEAERLVADLSPAEKAWFRVDLHGFD
jgi:hypothetical protein